MLARHVWVKAEPLVPQRLAALLFELYGFRNSSGSLAVGRNSSRLTRKLKEV
jgi:hypothetical protein